MDGMGGAWPGGAREGWPAAWLPGAGDAASHAAAALLDDALELLRGVAPHEWRSPAATAFGDAVAHLAAQVLLARGAAVDAGDAARRHHAALAEVGGALGAGARP